jgi:hypothetical protein
MIAQRIGNLPAVTGLDELVRLAPPPPSPVDGLGDWAAAETALGLALPSDFKDLIARYGRGEFCDLVFLYPPFGECTLQGYGIDILRDEREIRDEFPEDYPYPLHPEPGGLLVWGGTGNGQRLCWLTEGSPEEWPVVVWSPRGGDYERYAPGAVAFLVGWLSGRVPCRVFPEVFTATAQWFEPARKLAHVEVRLSDDGAGYPERLRVLRETLAPIADRYSTDFQDHFFGTAARWRVTFNGDRVRIGFPPGDDDAVRNAVTRAADLMGCRALN